MTKQAHTKTPIYNNEEEPEFIWDASGVLIAESLGDKAKERAAFIVQAVNSHEELVSTLKLAKRELEQFFGKENTNYAVAGIGLLPKIIDQALAKAGAK